MAREEDSKLVNDLLRRMAADRADFTMTFRRLSRFDASAMERKDARRDPSVHREALDAWAQRYAERLRIEEGL